MLMLEIFRKYETQYTFSNILCYEMLKIRRMMEIGYYKQIQHRNVDHYKKTMLS